MPQQAVVDVVQTRYRGQMIEAVAQRIVQKIAEGVAPGEIAVVAPHADGVLRFLLSETFRAADIPFAIVRRYETLREEPVVRACLALAILAHPDWGQRLSLFDLSGALERALKPLDRLRAELMARHLYDPRSGQLKPASALNATMEERLGRAALARYEVLCALGSKRIAAARPTLGTTFCAGSSERCYLMRRWSLKTPRCTAN